MAKPFEYSARNNFGAYAASARQAEQRGEWEHAQMMWDNAGNSICSFRNREYAATRAQFCQNAAARKWESAHAR
jgi:hypothetical protein